MKAKDELRRNMTKRKNGNEGRGVSLDKEVGSARRRERRWLGK